MHPDSTNTTQGGIDRNAPMRTQNITGIDLAHPSPGIDELSDTDKRFFAGTLREGYVQGLELCQRRSGTAIDRRANLKVADQWIFENVPFLRGVIGDVDSGGSSNR